jgi:adenine-specific DNA-methyltransferase
MLNELYKEITESDFISYKVDINKLKESEQDFKELTIDEKRKFLIEILDKNLLYVNYCDMEDETLAVTEEEKAFTRSFYGEEV